MPQKTAAGESSQPAESATRDEILAPTGEQVMVAVRMPGRAPTPIAEGKRKSATSRRQVVVRENFWRLAESWKRQLQADDKSPRTVYQYERALVDFARWMGEQSLPLHVEAVTRDMARTYMAGLLTGRNLATATASNRRIALKVFFGWLVAEGEIETNPFDATKSIKVDVKKPRRTISEDQLVALFSACRGNDFLARRDLAIFRVLFETGIRREELISMRTEAAGGMDLHDKQGRFWAEVTGKTGTRKVPIAARKTLAALDRYERARETLEHADGETAYWLTYRGTLKVGTVIDIVRRRASAAGIPDHLHPHLFRHTWAHHALAEGMNPLDVRRIGGWSNMDMIDHVYAQDLAHERAMDAARRLKLGDKV